MYLKEIVLGIFNRKNPYQLQFNKETWCITSLYKRCLPSDFNSGESIKVIVQLESDKTHVDAIRDQLNVTTVNQFLDLPNYFQLNKLEKKEKMLSVLHRGMYTIAKNKNWDVSVLSEAYECCIKSKLRNEWLKENRYVLSKDKKNYAGVVYNWDIDKFEAFVVFLDHQKKEIKRVKLLEIEPHMVESMGTMGWIDNSSVFYLYSKDKKQHWTASAQSA